MRPNDTNCTRVSQRGFWFKGMEAGFVKGLRQFGPTTITSYQTGRQNHQSFALFDSSYSYNIPKFGSPILQEKCIMSL